ncbi:MAG: molecular chaperone HtpG [Clostridia bacterium]|nr:molecular chaperone HtpG [Clostridia bacterium]
MAKKQFKTESKKLLDMMINSIYTHKEIFLRELISNASDALDKLYYRSLTDASVTLARDEYAITLVRDKEARTLTITDNGCGMTREELENNLGTIAKSGSFDFKQDEEAREKVDIIGQFGVGFYSAFMVAKRITVRSRVFGAAEAWEWQSEGADGYTVEPCEKAENGTEITLYLLPDTDDERYSDFLEEYKIRELVRKYSDYIRYPIRMEVEEHRPKAGGEEGKEPEYETVREIATLNSMVPLWKRPASEITEEEYNTFYREKFYDYEAPVKTIHTVSEGTASFHSLLFIPSHAPFDYYTKSYEKGLCLYSSGVMIMEKCADLVPDYFSFVRGLVDSADLSLNISREMLQHDRQLKLIARTVEKKIKSELLKLMESDREAYEKFYGAFGLQLKFGVYADYGMHKDVLTDLLMFTSSAEKKLVTLKEYTSRMKEEQKTIYYACGETVEAAAMLPQAEAVVDRGFEVLYLSDDVDEFALRTLGTYQECKFVNVSDESLDIASDEEKEKLKGENEGAKDMLTFMKETLGDKVSAVRFSASLKNHPVCLGSEGGISLGMEKVLNGMPNSDGSVKAATVLEINLDHPLAARLRALYEGDRDRLAACTKILYAQARLVGGMSVENPTELSELVCGLML